MMTDREQPRKVDPSHVEVLGASGESPFTRMNGSGFSRAGGIRVIRGGPALLVLLPILIPIALILLGVLAFAAIFFGRSIVRGFTARIRHR